MLKQKIFNKQLNQWVDTDVGDGIDAYVLPATTPENAGKTLIFDEKGNAIPVDPQGGSGLPEVEGSGKALVSIDGEWKEQEGYGYKTTIPALLPDWDGDATGKETFNAYAKVYDLNEIGWHNNPDDYNGFDVDICTGGECIKATNTTLSVSMGVNNAYDIFCYVGDEAASVGLIITEDDAIHGIHKGLYYTVLNLMGYYPSHFYPKSQVHKIDPKYIGEGQYGYEEKGGSFVTKFDGTVEMETIPQYVFDDDAILDTSASSFEIQFDGESYICTPSSMAGMWLLGNLNLMQDEWPDTGEPFCFYIYSDTLVLVVLEPGTYTLKIIQESDTVHKIDPKYLPIAPVAKTEDMTQPVGVDEEGKLFTKAGGGGNDFLIKLTYHEEEQEGDATWTSDKTFDQICAALRSGKNILVEFINNELYSNRCCSTLGDIYIDEGIDNGVFLIGQIGAMGNIARGSLNNFCIDITNTNEVQVDIFVIAVEPLN